MARSVIMSIAVCQHFDVDQYYIFQDSTDRLEQLFGRLRMLQRSNRNFDVVGLVDRILGIVSVQRFFDRNPRLDAGSRKLSGNITDHVNPASWGKSTNPATVNLGVQWNVGAALAGQALTADGVYSAEEVNYAQIATTSDATMLQPLGAAGGRPGVSPAIDRRTEERQVKSTI